MFHHSIRMLLIMVFLLALSTDVVTQQSEIRLLKMRKLMTEAESKKTGLYKLTPVESEELDKWLNTYTLRVVAALKSTPNLIESHIEGDFEGWEGETIFKLENGQIWQQSTYAYHYHYAYRPKVVIYKITGGHKMKVEGVTEEINVVRIK